MTHTSKAIARGVRIDPVLADMIDHSDCWAEIECLWEIGRAIADYEDNEDADRASARLTGLVFECFRWYQGFMTVSYSDIPEYPLMLIEWVDSSRLGDGWLDLDQITEPDPHTCVSVGFLVRENDRGKILVPTVADVKNTANRHTHGGIMIPACSILSERRLSVPAQRASSARPGPTPSIHPRDGHGRFTKYPAS